MKRIGSDVRQRGGEGAHVVAELNARVGAAGTAGDVEARGVPRRAVEAGDALGVPRANVFANLRMKVARVARRVVVNIAPAQRETALILIGSADRPAAEDGVRKTAPVGAPFLS